MKDFNVMITGCSKHSKGIIDCLQNNEDNVKVRVYGVDCNENNLLREGVEGCFVVPRINDPSYIDTLIRICKDNDIDIIIPYITAELKLLSENKSKFEDNGIHVSISNTESVIVANDKLKMAQRFAPLMPKQAVATNSKALYGFASDICYPRRKMCCKITNGCGGAGFAIVDDAKADDITLFNKTGVNRYIRIQDLARIVDTTNTTVLLQEYIEGLDYSVCVLADGKSNLKEVGYVGYTMQYGAVISGEIVKNEEAYKIANYVTKAIGLEGNACFDFLLGNDGQVYLLEVNPRINASLPFVTAAGINMPYLRCKQLLGYPIDSNDEVRYGLKMQKYYESKYYF